MAQVRQHPLATYMAELPMLTLFAAIHIVLPHPIIQFFFLIVFVSPLMCLLAQLVCRIILFDIYSFNHLLWFKWFISLQLLWCLLFWILIPRCYFAQTDRQDNGRVGNRHKYENKRMGCNPGEGCFTAVTVYFKKWCPTYSVSVRQRLTLWYATCAILMFSPIG